MVHCKLGETTELTIQDAGVNHANVVPDVVTGLQEVLQQDQHPTKIPKTILEPNNHVANTVQSTHQNLAAQLYQMHTMIPAIQLQ